MSFDKTFEKIIGKYQRMLDKSEHKWLKNVYLGKAKIVTIKKKGLRKDSPKRKLAEEVLNYYYLKNYGKVKKDVMDSMCDYMLWGK